jgi:hypothetical protein
VHLQWAEKLFSVAINSPTKKVTTGADALIKGGTATGGGPGGLERIQPGPAKRTSGLPIGSDH